MFDAGRVYSQFELLRCSGALHAIVARVSSVNNVHQHSGAAICAWLTQVVSFVRLSVFDAVVLSTPIVKVLVLCVVVLHLLVPSTHLCLACG
jgi:hypothetical protein